jgi:hypothetical protein
MRDKKRFMHELAVFLVAEQASDSIGLQMGRPFAKRWAALRNATPLFGYPTVKEAEKELSEWLLGEVK